jgi:hypothetical protein
MTSPSVSFRITRSTEDLAQTTHALSQRLVKLEQRLEALELQLGLALERRDQRDPQEISSLENLENVEQLLHDCRLLLGLEPDSPAAPVVDDSAINDPQSDALDQAEPGDDQDHHEVLAA